MVDRHVRQLGRMSGSYFYEWFIGTFEKCAPESKTKTQSGQRSLWSSKLRAHVLLAARLHCHWSSALPSKGQTLLSTALESFCFTRIARATKKPKSAVIKTITLLVRELHLSDSAQANSTCHSKRRFDKKEVKYGAYRKRTTANYQTF